MTAIDPVSYVRSTPPFDALPEETFVEAMRSLEVGFYPAGTWLVRAGALPLQHLYVIRTGSVRLERDGQTMEVLEEGETFGYTSLITRLATLDVVVEENLLAYQFPAAEFERLRAADAGFSRHFAVGLAERLKSSLDSSPVVTFQSDLSQAIGRLVRRPAVWIGPDATVAEAARVMRTAGISSVLVRADPPGIVTDSDFTRSVLAADLGPDTPVAKVVSRPLRTFAAETPLHEAWTNLLDAGVHHLPVVRDGEIVGVLTASDVLKSSAQGPIAVLRRVERLAGRESLPGYADKVAEMDAALLAGGLDATVIAGLVSRLDDALLGRILAWAEKDLGGAPGPYAWLAFGAEGRREAILVGHQDNGLVYEEGGAERRAWFQAFAERVNADLEAAGFGRTPAAHLARSSLAPLATWVRRFESCMDERRPQAAAILFDFRRAGGDLDLAPLEAMRVRARRDPAFLRHLARHAIEHQPPASILLRVRGRASAVDLEAQGILPVVHLARCYALEVGSAAEGTVERLHAAARAGNVSGEALESVTHAYLFLLTLELRSRLRTMAEGRTPRSEVALAALTPIERTRLKESFRAIRRWQDRSAFHYRTDFF